MRILALIHCLMVACWLVPGTVQAEPRIALVIGNSSYATVTTLDNPANDARLVAETLSDLGFDVTALIDATQIDMKRGIGQFGRKLREAGQEATGLFYYAGHGVQSFGANYLLPTDVALADAADLDLMAVEAQSVLRQMSSARNRTNIVILDACRNNPFLQFAKFGEDGLAEMQAPTGTFLAYATAPGEVALDGLDGHSPFTRAVAAQMRMPGQPIERMFKNVRNEVLDKSNGAQTPWDASSLTGEFSFAPASSVAVPELEAESLWDTVRNSEDAVQIMLFLRGYPNSPHAAEARRTLARLMESELGQDTASAPQADASISEAEEKMFAAAQSDGSGAGYAAYLQIYPDGAYADQARTEMAAMTQEKTTDATEPSNLPSESEITETVTFDTPIESAEAEIAGLTIGGLLGSAPLYPPMDGLPELYWKDQNCGTCHQWTRDRLCEQGNTYLSHNMTRSLDKPHPFGGAFKRQLRSWAASGCE